MLSAIAILRHVVNWQKSETPQSEKVVSSRILMLAMKACQEYLKSKKHQDIEEDQLSEVIRSYFAIKSRNCAQDTVKKFFLIKKLRNEVCIIATTYNLIQNSAQEDNTDQPSFNPTVIQSNVNSIQH